MEPQGAAEGRRRTPPRVEAVAPSRTLPQPAIEPRPSPPAPRPAPQLAAAAEASPPPGVAAAAAAPPPGPRSGWRVEARRLREEPPETGLDPVEALFGSSLLRRASDRPVVVLARRPRGSRYEYLELLKRVIREVFRVSSRSPPFVQHVARRLTEYQLAMMRGGAAIYVIDADSVAEAEAGGAALARLVSALEDRLREMYAQGFGFMVVYAGAEAMSRILEIWRPSIAAGTVYMRLPPAVRVSLPETPEVFEAVEALYSLRPGSLSAAESVDEAVVRAEESLYSCLEAAANDPSFGKYVRHAIDEEEARPDDAFLHYALKVAAVQQLVEQGHSESSIETEVNISNIPVDIVARRGWGSGLVVEVETLSGTLNPAARLSSVAARVTALGYPLWIVLPPHTAGIYKPYIEAVARRFEAYGTVEFYVLSPRACSLEPLEEYYERLDAAARRLAGGRYSLQTSAGGRTPSLL